MFARLNIEINTFTMHFRQSETYLYITYFSKLKLTLNPAVKF